MSNSNFCVKYTKNVCVCVCDISSIRDISSVRVRYFYYNFITYYTFITYIIAVIDLERELLWNLKVVVNTHLLPE